nr:unnamed protein product [Spirometra erinaceieuropaei]
MYKADILPTLLYGAETWTVHRKQAQTLALPPQLPSTDIEAEVAGPDPRHALTGADGNPQHPRHDETTTTALGNGRLPSRLFYGDVAKGSRRQGGQVRRYKDTDDFLEASADQPCKLGRPHQRPTDQEDSGDRRSNLRSQPSHFHQSQTRGSEIPIASTSQHQRSTSPTCPHCQRTFQATIGLV